MRPPLFYSVSLASVVFGTVLHGDSCLATDQLLGTHFRSRVYFLAAYRTKHPRELRCVRQYAVDRVPDRPGWTVLVYRGSFDHKCHLRNSLHESGSRFDIRDPAAKGALWMQDRVASRYPHNEFSVVWSLHGESLGRVCQICG